MEIFDSLDCKYKNPVGASHNKQNIHFKIFLSKDIKCSSAKLIIKNESKDELISLDMFWCGDLQDNKEMWECDFKPLNIGLYWYYFKLVCNYEQKILYKGDLSKAKISSVNSFNKSDIPLWQITVFKENLTVPEWLSGGIIYQIFPDRFNPSNTSKKGIPKDRVIRSDWGQIPEWRPNNNGEITNSDYFGGDLKGITQKLDYLKNLGVNCIYLNPIFEAHSNHRYNTANYSKIDPLLGTEDDFKELCIQAKNKGIKIILDGVFSHTGSDSIYFNKEKRYDSVGAYNSKNSPYFNWYNFNNWPDKYNSWWGFKTLPEVNEMSNDYIKYILGENGIIEKWLTLGASGWRLDVADELPDEFIKMLKSKSRNTNNDSVIIGEVWEDASSKISYSNRRSYLLGDELDSVMNYPFREAILNFIRGKPIIWICNQISSIIENYPKPILDSLMNVLGTHDTPRILTEIAGDKINDKNIQAKTKLTSAKKEYAIKLLKIAVAMQYSLPGVPSIYYGDETAMEGYQDPFCRGCYPWNHQNTKLIQFYKRLGNIRKNNTEFKNGEFKFIHAEDKFLAYTRTDKDNNSICCIFNASNQEKTINIPQNFNILYNLIGESEYDKTNIKISPESFTFLKGKSIL